MSISHALSNALSGMTATSRMAEIVSSNVSNALTEGYGRRSLNLSSATVGGRGAGVEIGGVHRHIDAGVLADRRLADAGLGSFSSLVSTMNSLQDVVGRPGEAGSISDRIVAVESALIEAASDPASSIRLGALNDRLNDLTSGLNTAADAVQQQRAEADATIAALVEELNTALQRVERLNADITYSRNTGQDPSAFVDQRQVVIDQIAQIVPVRELNRDGGQVALMTPDGEMLIDGPAKEFGFTPNVVVTSDMTLASGGLGGITYDGVPISTDGIGRLAGGALGAAFVARDQELVAVANGLDRIAADLIGRVQDPVVDSTLASGDPGLLTDNGLAFDGSAIQGLAERISVNASVDPASGGSLTNLRDGINAVALGPAGNSSLIESLSAAFSRPTTVAGDPVAQTAAGRAANLMAEIGNKRLSFETELGFENARWTALKEAEAAGGVDTDYEMQMLLRIEQAYAANARVIQTVESMIQRLIEI